MKIRLKGIPPSLNATAGKNNVWNYRQQKAVWTKMVFYSARQFAPAEPFRKAIVKIDYHFKNRNRHDPDNYCGKFLLDGLTKSGIIADDSFGVIELHLSGHYDPAGPFTEIEVTEVEE